MKHTSALILFLAATSLMCCARKQEQLAQPPPVEQPAPDVDTTPKTLEEAHLQIEKHAPVEELAKIDAMESEGDVIEYHFGGGLSMRNNWGLWGDGPLAQHMNQLGFYHADDMSGVILRTFWCRRHKKEFRLKERAAYYDIYWKTAAQPPETAKDPKDGSEVDWNRSIIAGDDKTPREIHLGESHSTGRTLAYEYDKGVYEPDAALLEKAPDITTLTTPGTKRE